MDERRIIENKPLNLQNDDFKIKEEVTNLHNGAENFNELVEDEISPFALSCGEVFIVKNQEDDPLTWWIICNICKGRFESFENFLDHATNIHLKSTNEILKTENENIYNESSNKILKTKTENIYNESSNGINNKDKYFDVSRLLEDSDEDYKVDADDGEGTDSDESITQTLIENKEIMQIIEDIKSDDNIKKKGLLPRHCEKCNRTFKKPSTLRRHLNLHLKKDNKMYECKICHEKFASEQKRLYRNHRDRAHKEKIPCLLCEKSFGSKFYLDSHMKTHTGTKDFKCNRCQAAFYSKTSLSGHIRKTHLTPKVPCKYCNKLFRPGSCLEIHERIHTGEKPFVCEQCGTAFQTNSLLQNHIKRHNNDRRFECDICGKKFFNHTYLRDHKVTHTDEKPYGCEICNARFNSGPALRKHKNLHSGVKKYQCKICGKSYAQSPGLYAHMKSHNIAEDKNMKVSVL